MPQVLNPSKPRLQDSSAKEKRFDWPLCYEAEKFVLDHLQTFLDRNSFARQLSERMRAETGTLLLDWVDYLVLSPQNKEVLREVGYREDRLGETPSNQSAFWHPEALLPRILIDTTVVNSNFPAAVAIRTESISDFMAAHGVTGEPEGGPFSRFRHILVSFEHSTRLEAVERRGYRGYVPLASKAGQVKTLVQAHELWKTRRRLFEDDQKGFEHLQTTLDRIIG